MAKGRAVRTWTKRRTVLASVALLALQGPVRGQDVVAELSLDAPRQDEFLLRGTVPVPPGVVIPGRPGSPLTILAPDGTPVPTQAETVSRYGADADGADVVELIARGERPAGVEAGERVTYRVALLDSPADTFEPHAAVEELLATHGAFQVRARDVFEHRYAAKLGAALRKPDAQTRRDGVHVRELVAHRVMLPITPVAGDEGTLPRLMGVHAWVRTYDRAGFLLVDLHVHNGFDGRDLDDPRDDLLDRVYFRGLRLRLPEPWRVIDAFEHPGRGPAEDAGALRDHALLREREGELYMMPRQARPVPTSWATA